MVVVYLDYKENERVWEVFCFYGDILLVLVYENKMLFSFVIFIFGKVSNVLIDCGELSIFYIFFCFLCF